MSSNPNSSANPPLISPDKATLGAIEGYSASHESARAQLKEEVEARMEQNRADVWKRIKIDSADVQEDAFFTSCVNNLLSTESGSIAALKGIVAEADQPRSRQRQEPKMYPHLVSTLDTMWG